MCHCHFLYDCIYYSSTRKLNRLIKQYRHSFRRRKSSFQSLYNHHVTIDENFCPYTRIISSNIDDNQRMNKKKIDIDCPMEETCADMRIMNELLLLKKDTHK